LEGTLSTVLGRGVQVESFHYCQETDKYKFSVVDDAHVAEYLEKRLGWMGFEREDATSLSRVLRIVGNRSYTGGVRMRPEQLLTDTSVFVALYLLDRCRAVGKYNIFEDTVSLSVMNGVCAVEEREAHTDVGLRVILRMTIDKLVYAYRTVKELNNDTMLKIGLEISCSRKAEAERACARTYFGSDEFVPKDMNTANPEYEDRIIVPMWELWMRVDDDVNSFKTRVPEALKRLSVTDPLEQEDIATRSLNTFINRKHGVKKWVESAFPPEM
jgi:hypothetical protein